jgi:hypothetical protein
MTVIPDNGEINNESGSKIMDKNEGTYIPNNGY